VRVVILSRTASLLSYRVESWLQRAVSACSVARLVGYLISVCVCVSLEAAVYRSAMFHYPRVEWNIIENDYLSRCTLIFDSLFYLLLFAFI
jgi:hypothetical protein